MSAAILITCPEHAHKNFFQVKFQHQQVELDQSEPEATMIDIKQFFLQFSFFLVCQQEENCSESTASVKSQAMSCQK